MPPDLDHLLVHGFTDPQDFKSTLSVRRQAPPQQDRKLHGEKLLGQIADLAEEEAELRERRSELGLPENVGTTISIEISPPGVVDYFKQLEWKRDGIEILSAVDSGNAEIVTLHVPDGKLSAFEKRITAYMNESVKPKKGKEGEAPKPKNATLVNAITSFRRAAFDELWTDEEGPSKDEEAPEWFQVWLRLGTGTAADVRNKFAESAGTFNLEVEAGFVTFPGRVVVAVRGSRVQMQQALELLDAVAEIRAVKPTAEFFLADLKPYEQAEWLHDLQNRLTHAPAEGAAHVTLLDTGVNQGHALLQPVLAVADMHAANQQWGATDHHGHGTQMAGVSIYGDLTKILAGGGQVHVPHRLESVKLLPPVGQNPPHLYGAVMGAAVAAVEGTDRKRTFALMTTADGLTSGLPSEWSAAIDRLACGLSLDGTAADANGQSSRLFVMSGGNIQWPQWGEPNDLHPIEDPGQAWNALTVGACTDLDQIDTTKWPDLHPIGKAGALSPCSRTSLLWKRSWPFKPDVVAEGGNGSMHAEMGPASGPESLRLLSTSQNPAVSPFAETGDTSTAAAEVARICGHISARYPDYWPETVRALIVHGARVTPAMRANLPLKLLKTDKENLLRRVGYGKANMDESVNSTLRRPTMVLQETLVPYVKEGSQVKLGKMNLHQLPWPLQQLEDLYDADVSLRITLSYFVAPNPSRRGWQSKFRYQSHALRFAVKGATESDEGFLQRINKIEREELEAGAKPESTSDPDGNDWVWGAQLRSRGSLHSDVWRGRAASLAQKSHIAVFPVGGWWKDWADSGYQSQPVRYSLVVSLEAPESVDVDIYTPIANLIGIQVLV
jgi:hypothetical protein